MEQVNYRLWSGIAVALDTCLQCVPVPATMAHYTLVQRRDQEVSTFAKHKIGDPT